MSLGIALLSSGIHNYKVSGLVYTNAYRGPMRKLEKLSVQCFYFLSSFAKDEMRTKIKFGKLICSHPWQRSYFFFAHVGNIYLNVDCIISSHATTARDHILLFTGINSHFKTDLDIKHLHKLTYQLMCCYIVTETRKLHYVSILCVTINRNGQKVLLLNQLQLYCFIAIVLLAVFKDTTMRMND